MLNISYNTILNRFSTRRYETNPLGKNLLENLSSIQGSLEPLIKENTMEFSVYDFNGRYDRMDVMGAFGATLNPPHFLLGHITGESHLLTDIGFRLEQVVLWLQENEIGSCYIGCLRREKQFIRQFDLSETARLGSLVVFGNPDTSLLGKSANRLMRSTAGATRRKAVEEIFFSENFNHPVQPPEWLASIIDAGRYAPSAVNAQPWRFLLDGGVLYLYITRNHPKYSLGDSEHYCFLDGGIAMANVVQAVHSLGMMASWSVEPISADLLESHNPPENLQFLAKLEFIKSNSPSNGEVNL